MRTYTQTEVDELLAKRDIEVERIRMDVVEKAELARSRKVTNIKKTLQEKRDNGQIVVSMGPAWLRLDEQRKNWIVIPEKVEVVERIFKMAARGFSPGFIANRLRETATPTMSTAEEWNGALVSAVLKNAAVIGRSSDKNNMDGLPHEKSYPIIIKPDVFSLVQEHISLRSGTGGPISTTVSSLFSGLIDCECGAKLKYKESKEGANLYCINALEGKGCVAVKLPYQPLEKQLMRWICEDQQFDMRVNRQVANDPRRVIEQNIKDLQNAVFSMKKSLSNGDVVSETIQDTIKSCVETINKLKEKLEKTDTRLVRSGNAETLKLWNEHNQADGKERVLCRLRLQSAIRLIISSIEVARKNRDVYGVKIRPLMLRGPIYDIYERDGSVLPEHDQLSANRIYANDGIEFKLVIS